MQHKEKLEIFNETKTGCMWHKKQQSKGEALQSQDYSEIKTYYRGTLKFTYRCSYCMHSNDGTPGKICKGCGRISLEKRNDDENAD